MIKLLYWYWMFSFVACTSPEHPQETENLQELSWDQILEQAHGQTVTLMMWQGDPFINKYIEDYVTPTLQQQYGITLQVVGGQGNQVVGTLMAEMEAGKQYSEIDMMWINGETFYQLRQIDALYGPFLEKLPNAQYIDLDNPFIAQDFQQPIAGFEAPWGNVQLALIYDSNQVHQPPRTLETLERWVKAHPGKFTIGNDFTGMTLLKSWLIHLAGGKNALRGPFDEATYQQYSVQLWEYINRIKPYFWNQGATFPPDVARMHQLYANGELWFTMSNNDGEVDNKIAQELFPESSRAYVMETGTIQNSHYMGITRHSGQHAAAMAVCNFLISPEAQWKKLTPSVWGDGTVLDVDQLPAEWQEKFRQVPGRQYAPRREHIQPYALQEPASEYMIRLFEDFRKYVINP